MASKVFVTSKAHFVPLSLTTYKKQRVSQEGMPEIRFDFLEMNKETMQFIKRRYKDYIKWLPKCWTKKKLLLSTEEFPQVYGIEAFDALSCIKWSFKVLKEFKYL